MTKKQATEKPKLFTWSCGAKFEARLTPAGRSLQYRQHYNHSIGRWESVGPVSKARAFVRGENPYGLHRLGTEYERPYAPGGSVPRDTPTARRCVRRVLKHLGVL